MGKWQHGWSVIAIALIGSACVAETGDEVGAGTEELSRGGSLTGRTPSAPRGCSEEIRVGVSITSMCPYPSSTSGWSRHQYSGFTDDSRPVCRYEWGGVGAPDASQLPWDGSRSPSVWLDYDCPVVTVLADPADEVFEAYNDAWHRQMERAPRLPVVGGSLPALVRVAVLDTSVDSGPADIEPMGGAYPHGRAVGLAIREMTCPDGRASEKSACIPEFKSYLSLDLVSGAEETAGGYHGHLTTLALRVEEAVTDWLAGGRAEHLVINLSVGWHGDHTRNGKYTPTVGTTDAKHSGAQAVRVAINRARCAGALVIAAAGNVTGGPDGNEGPMYPAAWADDVRWHCGAREALVYAAAGVDGTDQDLLLSRPGARTEIVAPAFQVMVDNTQDGSPAAPTLPPMTGSSFAAAGLSAAAAIVWAYRPNLTAEAVIEQVYQSGEELEPYADVCLGTCDRAHRLSICRTATAAMNAACGALGVPCPAAPECARVDAGKGSNATLESIPDDATTYDPGGWTTVAAEMCAGDRAWADPTVPADELLCPDEHYTGVLMSPGAVAGQPGGSGCHVCTLVASPGAIPYFYMALSSSWDPETPLSNPVLKVKNNPPIALSYAVGTGPLTPGGKYKILLPNLLNPAAASVAFTVTDDLLGTNGTYTLQEQVLVLTQ